MELLLAVELLPPMPPTPLPPAPPAPLPPPTPVVVPMAAHAGLVLPEAGQQT